MTPVLELRGLEVRAAGRTILRVASLALGPGETLAVLGANGAGKSTLLRAAGGLRRIFAGQRLLDGRQVDERALRTACAAVLQRPLLRRGTVLANACTGLRFRGVGRREAVRRARPWLERLGVADLERRHAATLSGGEAQRVSLARALALEPRVLLLDEPFGALDAPTRGELLSDLGSLLAGTGTSTLFVTHDRAEAAALADRIAILDGGAVRQQGPATVVLEGPADAACARLLGFENVLELDGRTVAVRARDVVPAASAPDATALAVTVMRLLPVADRLLAVCAGECSTLVAEVSAGAGVRVGDRLELAVAPGRACPLG